MRTADKWTASLRSTAGRWAAMPDLKTPGRPTQKILAPPVLLAVLCMAAGYLADRYYPIRIVAGFERLRVVVCLLLFAVFGFVLWSAIHSMNARGTTVNPYGKATAVVSSGPFRYSRNPIYVGLLLIAIGVSLAFNSAWLLAAAAALFGLLHFGVVQPEEHFLSARFGAEYREYTKRVRRWL